MSTSQDSNIMKNNKNSLKGLSIFLILFVLIKAGAILLYLFEPLLSVLTYVLGTAVLIAGIFIVSKSNDDLFPGIKVSILLAIAVIFDFIATFLTIASPATLPSSGTFLEQVGNLDASFGPNTYFIAWAVLLTGIFMGLSAYFFNEWFNDHFTSNKEFKTYKYFGALFFAGEVILLVGYVVLRRAAKQILSGFTGASSQSIAFSNGIITLGILFLLVAFIVEIFAGIQMFTMVNKSSGSSS